jgi:hypothetical protein
LGQRQRLESVEPQRQLSRLLPGLGGRRMNLPRLSIVVIARRLTDFVYPVV